MSRPQAIAQCWAVFFTLLPQAVCKCGQDEPRRSRNMERIHVIDTHTGGEPTRVVIGGGPDLGGGNVAAQREVFRKRFDEFRSAVVNEPRGSDVMVGALLCPPADRSCVAGVIFFNNVGTLGMCGHGT